jgi:hypothetical protein|tara:strand:- start:233 stop:490 length:258 start_codon:yes stop_codon:yes gene_type:complete
MFGSIKGIATVLSALLEFGKLIFSMIRDEKLREEGRRQIELEGLKASIKDLKENEEIRRRFSNLSRDELYERMLLEGQSDSNQSG